MPKGKGSSGESDAAPQKKKKVAPSTQKARLARSMNRRKRNPFVQCSFLTAQKKPCKATVHKYDEAMDLYFCSPHYAKYFGQGYSWLMNADVINNEIEKLAAKQGLKVTGTVVGEAMAIDKMKDKARQQVDRATRLIESTENPMAKAVASTAGRIRWGGSVKTGEHVQVIDIDYYTPNYQNDHYLQLEEAIRRAQAMVNLRVSMLAEVQERNKEVMTTESEGEIPVGTQDGVFQGRTCNKVTKPLTYYELQLKIHEGIDKAEARLQQLLKQREDMLPNALLILKREGIVFSREAGQMILAVAKKEDERPLERYHQNVKDTIKDKPVTLDVPLEAPLQSGPDDEW